LFVLAAMLVGCSVEEGHWAWTCGNDRQDLDLICEMSKTIPDSHAAEELYAVDLCRGVDSDDKNMNLEFVLRSAFDEGKYAAIGGYCDFRPRLTSFLEYLEGGSSSFEGVLMQVHSCDPPQYCDLVDRLEEVGFRVTVHSLRGCAE
jgi:hypothetical protein